MVKQTKTFKKGNVTKKALSAILAASMVMTSSSFVMAAPVEVEDVAVEAAAVAEDAAVADVVEDVDAGEESVGVDMDQANPTIKVEGNTSAYVTSYTGQEVKPAITITYNDGADRTLVLNQDYTVTYKNNVNAGTATAVIHYQGIYSGKDVEINYTINPITLTQSNCVIKFTDPGFRYTGKEQKPEIESITVTDPALPQPDKAKLKVVADPSTDKLIAPGSHTVKIEDEDGNFDFSALNYTYNIDKAVFNNDAVTVTCAPLKYNGNAQKLSVITVKTKDGTELTKGTDYDLYYIDANGNEEAEGSFTGNTAVGTYTVVLKSKDATYFEADGKVTATYEIQKGTLAFEAENNADIDGAEKVDGVFEIPYTGEDIVVDADDIAIGALTQGDAGAYKVADKTVIGKDAGSTATITLTGVNAYAGETATLTVKVAPAEIKEPANAAAPIAGEYVIEAFRSKGSDKPFVTITKKGAAPADDVVLVDGKDYTYTVSKDKAKVIVEGKGNYTTKSDKGTTIEAPITVGTAVYLTDPAVTVEISGTYAYHNGEQITPLAKDIVVKYNGVAATKDVDYTISYGDNNTAGKDAGSVIITAVANGKFDTTKTRTVKFDITGTDIASKYTVAPIDDIVVTPNTAKTYVAEPKVIYSGSGASAGLTKNTDYTVEYYMDGVKVDPAAYTDADSTTTGKIVPKAGTVVTVKVLGKGQFTGELTKTYKIVASDDNVITNKYVAPIADQAYTGAAITPAVTVKVSENGAKLVEGKDYTVAYSYNTKVGTAYVTITGIGEYKGTKVVSFNIVGEMDQTIEVLAAQERDLGNGTRTLNSKATKIKYTTAPETAVTYTSSDENVVTVDAEGNLKYTGLGEATITIEAKAENGYKAAKKEIKVVVKLAKPSFTPFSKNNAFTLTSSTVKGAEKFEVQYATKKNFSNAKTKTFTTTTAGKIRQVKVAAADKRTYYVRVRAVSGTTKSAWSGVKTVATK